MTRPDAASGDEICALGAVELGRLYRAGTLSPVRVTEAVLERIARVDPQLNAFISVSAEDALRGARAASAAFEAGIDLGPMHGVPVSLKDVIRARGSLTTAASPSLVDAPEDRRDAEVVARLRAAGAVLIGKTNLNEYAIGSPGHESPFGVVQNPRGKGRQAGGSSGGSAAAVAAGCGALSIGTDTGGSIRFPSVLCGTVGLKPTNGLVPATGVIPLSHQLDAVGPIGRSVADVAACLEVLAGHDPDDPWSIVAPRVRYRDHLRAAVSGMRVGIPDNECFSFGFDGPRRLQQAAQRALTNLGMVPVPMTLDGADEVMDAWDAIVPVDLAVVHEQLGTEEAACGAHFRQRWQDGRETTATRYAAALAFRRDITAAWRRVFKDVDVIALPGNVVAAPPIGVAEMECGGRRFLSRVLCSPANRGANLTGFPSIVLPVGLDDGLPIAIQLMAGPFQEARLLAVAAALEAALGDLVRAWGIDLVGYSG